MTEALTINDLRKELKSLDITVDYRWSEKTLRDKIIERKEQIESAAESKRKRIAGDEAKAKIRADLILERGPWAEFADTRSGRLSFAVGHALMIQKQQVKIAAKLADKFSGDPAYTMSWSGEYFTHAAEFQVAMQLQGAFELGATVEQIVSSITSEVLNGARWPARSTSVVSNLMEQEVLAARSRLLSTLNFGG